jgi:hypothetical protein
VPAFQVSRKRHPLPEFPVPDRLYSAVKDTLLHKVYRCFPPFLSGIGHNGINTLLFGQINETARINDYYIGVGSILLRA